MKKFIILISLPLFWTTAILINPAQSGAISHGLSLFGDLKYEKSFTNFDYVNPDAPKGGGVRYATVGSFDSLNPYILKGVAAAGSGLPFDSLLVSAADEPDSAYGLIASAVERAKDNRWVKFKINAKAHWHDGSPIRAEDIVYSFNTLVDKGHPNFSIMLSGVSTVEKINDEK